MISCGNLIAKFRKSELLLLEEVLDRLSAAAPVLSSDMVVPRESDVDRLASNIPAETTMPFAENSNFGHDGIQPQTEIQEECNFHDGFTTAQILAVANSIESGDAEWVSHALAQNNIW
jgi:hypothetical protein